MIGLDLKLNIIGDKAYLTHDHALSFQQLGFPDWAVPFYSPAYWVITIIKYNEQEHSLFASIKSYQNGETEFDQNQIIWENELKHILKIKFRGISTIGLNKTMHFNRPMVLPTLKEPDQYTEPLIFTNEEKHEIIENENNALPAKNIQKKVPIFIKQKFSIPFKDVRFVYGGVTFKK